MNADNPPPGDRPMHICHVNMPIEYYSPVSGGAVATVIMNQARELTARGHDVSVLTITDGNPVYDIGRVIRIAAPQRHELSIPQRLVCKLKRAVLPWDYPYYGYYRASVVGALARMRPRPDVVVVHNDLVSPIHMRRLMPDTRIVAHLHNEQRTRQPSLERAVAATSVFTCVSDHVRRWTIARYGIASHQVATVYNGIDLAAFRPPACEPDRAEGLNVLFIGRLNADKGPDLLADAVTQLNASGCKINLTVAGSVWWYGHERQHRDPYFRALMPKIEAARARYLGPVNRTNVPDLLRAQDVVVVPSRWSEPFGLVLLEAMACGRAVITTRRGGIPEVCGDAAAYFDPDHPGSLPDALRAFAQAGAALSAAKHASRARADAFTWAASVDQFEAAVSSVRPPRGFRPGLAASGSHS
ncbi:MAG: glycosyltransferase family 4 protein [Phycisphaerae bacterium]